LTTTRVYITGIGIISPLGKGLAETKKAIKLNRTGIKPVTLFPVPHTPLPAGEIDFIPTGEVPRTHALALIAAKEALKDSKTPPDAIVLGSTTGGMPLTENLIKEKNLDPHLYRYHATGSVAEYIAKKTGCTGIVLTVSTACSSGSLAIKLGLELLRSGKVKTVLAGGADALCRLTYHGFNSLQLIDPNGARPLDQKRKGMSVSEGAAMLLLSAHNNPPENAFAEILGAGLSCDAYHPASPHPEGVGAAEAMKAALKDAGITQNDIDYINLHGTGTIDNDLSEAKALHSVFPDKLPYLSSTKGAFGHSLAAAGAIEAVISVISITENILPANTGCETPDPALKLTPVQSPIELKSNEGNVISTVLSNSFGFGGNNAAVIINKTDKYKQNPYQKLRSVFTVTGSACITGVGNTNETLNVLKNNGTCNGLVNIEHISEILPKSKIRRLKLLPKMVLSLASLAYEQSDKNIKPSSIYFGTGWGSLSETFDFLDKLYESGEQFPSPTDFIGSVHNAPAGQAAIWFDAKKANITATGGDFSFEQALICAELLTRNENEGVMLIGADEHHNVLSKILDESTALDSFPSDGGGALILTRSNNPGLKIIPSFLGYSINNKKIIHFLIQSLGGAARINELFGAVFAGIPAGRNSLAREQLAEFQSIISFNKPVIDYRKFTGEFASASAVATVLALQYVKEGAIPSLSGTEQCKLNGKGILLLGFGDFISTVEIQNQLG